MSELSPVYPGFINRFMQSDVRSFRVGCFVLALCLYGALGSPTPDHPGALEMVIAALLVLSIGVFGFFWALKFDVSGARWKLAGQALLVFGLSIPLIGGVVGGNAPGLLVRDIAAFLFVCLPLFLCGVLGSKGRSILYGTLFVGVLFGLRAGVDVPHLGGGDKLFYLANMPSVLFAAVFFAGSGVEIFAKSFSVHAVLKALVFVGLAAICLYPIIETQQRASAGVFAMSLAFIIALYGYRQPRRVFILLGVIAAGLVFIAPELGEVFDALRRKSDLVGVNMRAEEWAAVWGEVSVNPVRLMFGQGWGATFSSPAVADIEVNFTHGLLSSLLLKSGFVGLGLGLVYLGVLGRGVLKSLKVEPVLAVALIGPIAIDVFLYASFKSLDFGLVLLLAAGLIEAGRFYGDETAPSVEPRGDLLYSGSDSK